MRKNRLNLFVLIWKKNIKIYCMPHFGSLNCRVYLTNDAHISHAKTDVVLKYSLKSDGVHHGLRTPGEEIAITARSKIKSQSQIFRYGRNIFCLPHRPRFSDFFDLCLHWVSVVLGQDCRTSDAITTTLLFSATCR